MKTKCIIDDKILKNHPANFFQPDQLSKNDFFHFGKSYLKTIVFVFSLAEQTSSFLSRWKRIAWSCDFAIWTRCGRNSLKQNTAWLQFNYLYYRLITTVTYNIKCDD